MRKLPTRRRVLMPWALVIALLVAACGASEDTSTDTPTNGDNQAVEVTVHTTEFSFEPDPIEVPAGTPVTLILVNDGVVEHDLTIDALNLSMAAQPGETVRETITFDAGTYEVHCTVPGHHDAGMIGTLVAG